VVRPAHLAETPSPGRVRAARRKRPILMRRIEASSSIGSPPLGARRLLGHELARRRSTSPEKTLASARRFAMDSPGSTSRHIRRRSTHRRVARRPAAGCSRSVTAGPYGRKTGRALPLRVSELSRSARIAGIATRRVGDRRQRCVERARYVARPMPTRAPLSSRRPETAPRILRQRVRRGPEAERANRPRAAPAALRAKSRARGCRVRLRRERAERKAAVVDRGELGLE